MRRLLAWSAGIAFAVILTLALAYGTYDLLQFQPHRARINGLIESAQQQDGEPSAEMIGLLRVSSRYDTAVYASRLLRAELGAVSAHEPMITWHFRNVLWWSLVALHLTEKEHVILTLSLAPAGPDKPGASAMASSLFGRKLSELSLGDAATIVALVQSPSAYNNPERLQRIREMLLKKYAEVSRPTAAQ